MKRSIYIVIIIILIIITPNRIENFDSSYVFSLSLIYIFLLTIFLFQHVQKNKNWLRVDVIFLIGYSIVHFQIPFLASVGIDPVRPDFIWVHKQVVNFATWMSLMSITLWMLGYNYIEYSRIKFKPSKLKYGLNINFGKYDLILLTSLLSFLALAGSSLFKGEYDGGNSWGEGANYMYLFLRTLLYLRIIYFFRNLEKGISLKAMLINARHHKLFIIILFVYTFLFLVSGDRGPVLQVALLIGGSYAVFIKPISLKKLFAFIFIGALMFSIIRFGRGRDASEFDNSNIFKRGYSSYLENKDETNITNELASSVRIQYRALAFVPESHPYLYGLTFLTVGIGVIPFAGSFIVEFFNIPYQYTASSKFFTYAIRGANPTAGDGSEILADIYINFGLYGTFLLMFLFGIITALAHRKANQKNFIFCIIYLVILYNAISMNRGMLFTPLKDVVYFLFFNYIFTKTIK